MNTLRLYFSTHWRDSASPCAWALCNDNGTVLQSGVDPLAALPKGHECIAIAAADRVLFTAATLPSGSRRRWQAALPFAVEEHTLPDPEDNHVVPGATLADGKIALAVVDKAWLKRITEACQAAGLSLRRMVAETLLPPLAPASWTLVLDGAGGFVRTGEASGMAIDGGDASHAPLALRLAADLPEKIEVRHAQRAANESRALPQWSDLPVALVAGSPWDWRQAPIPADALNLLWGEFTPRARIREWWPKLRPVALILLAALAIEVLGVNLQWAMLSGEKRALTQDMEQNFRATFGASGVLVNAPLQMRRNLAELRHQAGQMDDSDFLALLDAAAPVLPAGSVQALHYESGRLDADVKAASHNELQSLQQRLQTRGLAVQMGEIHEAQGGAEARLSIQIGGGR
jgi:general secretion pathway protein L